MGTDSAKLKDLNSCGDEEPLPITKKEFRDNTGKAYLSRKVNIWAAERSAVRNAFVHWEVVHDSKGTKVRVPVVNSIKKAFWTSNARNFEGTGWDAWVEIFTVYRTKALAVYAVVRFISVWRPLHVLISMPPETLRLGKDSPANGTRASQCYGQLSTYS